MCVLRVVFAVIDLTTMKNWERIAHLQPCEPEICSLRGEDFQFLISIYCHIWIISQPFILNLLISRACYQMISSEYNLMNMISSRTHQLSWAHNLFFSPHKDIGHKYASVEHEELLLLVAHRTSRCSLMPWVDCQINCVTDRQRPSLMFLAHLAEKVSVLGVLLNLHTEMICYITCWR